MCKPYSFAGYYEHPYNQSIVFVPCSFVINVSAEDEKEINGVLKNNKLSETILAKCKKVDNNFTKAEFVGKEPEIKIVVPEGTKVNNEPNPL